MIARLRSRLSDLSGSAIHPSWFLRLDPDIQRAYGRADFVVHRYANLIDKIRAERDPLGIHVHFYRWDDERRTTFSDHADDRWTTHCLETAAGTFHECFGEPARRTSQGGFFLSEALIDKAIALGIEVDVTPEPGYPAQTEAVTFSAYATAASPDFSNCPRYPYVPTRVFCTPATRASEARPILIVPLTAYNYQRALTTWPRHIVKTILGRRTRALPLNPWKPWPSPQTYWDLVARAADEGPACYVAIAVRTDAPGSYGYNQSRPLFEYLPNHPIAQRLRFVDPLSPEIRKVARLPQDLGRTLRPSREL
jgi:hypothetical protein